MRGSNVRGWDKRECTEQPTIHNYRMSHHTQENCSTNYSAAVNWVDPISKNFDTRILLQCFTEVQRSSNSDLLRVRAP